MSRFLSVALAALLAMATTTGAFAKEGADQYPNGAEGFMAGALPPPGNYFINYAGYYSGEFQDGDGNKVDGVEVDALFNALRIVHVTEKKIWGGDLAFAALLPLVDQEIDTPVGTMDDSGLGDLVLTPFIVGWHRPNLHTIFAVDLFLDTGDDDIGAGYNTVEPLFAVTYLNDNGFEASAKFMYSIHTENSDTDYQSGDEFHMDYTFAKHKEQWAYGVGGYYVKQLEEDEVDGSKNGVEGQVFAIGPQVKWDGGEKGTFIFKWHHETDAESRFEGDKIWFKYITRL